MARKKTLFDPDSNALFLHDASKEAQGLVSYNDPVRMLEYSTLESSLDMSHFLTSILALLVILAPSPPPTAELMMYCRYLEAEDRAYLNVSVKMYDFETFYDHV